MTEYTLIFATPQLGPVAGDYVEYTFPYSIIESKHIGTPDEKSYLFNQVIVVRASGSLIHVWELDKVNLIKVLFEFGHRHLAKQIRNGSLSKHEILNLSTTDVDIMPCPFDATRILEPTGATINISVNDRVRSTNINTSGGTYIEGDVNTGGAFIGRDLNISYNLPESTSLEELLRLAIGLRELRYDSNAARREQWDRIAEYMVQIANAIEQACSEIRNQRVPYREFVMLQRYASRFPQVVAPAFPTEQGEDAQKLRQLLHNSITSIAGFDILIFKFHGLPIPYDLYSSKAGLLQAKIPEENPPVELANLSDKPPTIEELEEVAAVFKAEAVRIRTFVAH